MHGNAATPLYLEDQIIEKKPMEPNIGVITNEINTILGELRDGQTRLTGEITTVRAEMGTIRAEMGTLAKQIDARVDGMELPSAAARAMPSPKLA